MEVIMTENKHSEVAADQKNSVSKDIANGAVTVETKSEDAVKTDATLQFTNDFSAEDKAKIKDVCAKAIAETLEQPVLTVNALARLAQVAHGSIKSRAKNTSSAREIVFGIINGVRATRTPSVNADSVKSFIGSLPEEEKQKMLNELLGKK